MKTIYFKFYIKLYLFLSSNLDIFIFDKYDTQYNAQTYHWVEIMIVVNLY